MEIRKDITQDIYTGERRTGGQPGVLQAAVAELDRTEQLNSNNSTE